MDKNLEYYIEKAKEKIIIQQKNLCFCCKKNIVDGINIYDKKNNIKYIKPKTYLYNLDLSKLSLANIGPQTIVVCEKCIKSEIKEQTNLFKLESTCANRKDIGQQGKLF